MMRFTRLLLVAAVVVATVSATRVDLDAQAQTRYSAWSNYFAGFKEFDLNKLNRNELTHLDSKLGDLDTSWDFMSALPLNSNSTMAMSDDLGFSKLQEKQNAILSKQYQVREQREQVRGSEQALKDFQERLEESKKKLQENQAELHQWIEELGGQLKEYQDRLKAEDASTGAESSFREVLPTKHGVVITRKQLADAPKQRFRSRRQAKVSRKAHN